MMMVVRGQDVLMRDADEDARPMASKYLVKWRPGFVESQTAGADGAAPAARPSGAAPIAA